MTEHEQWGNEVTEGWDRDLSRCVTYRIQFHALFRQSKKVKRLVWKQLLSLHPWPSMASLSKREYTRFSLYKETRRVSPTLMPSKQRDSKTNKNMQQQQQQQQQQQWNAQDINVNSTSETTLDIFNVHGSAHRKNILIYIQRDVTLHSLFYLETALHVSVVPPPIIRRAINCIYSIWYLSHRYCYLPL
jgi:hypothetical protein